MADRQTPVRSGPEIWGGLGDTEQNGGPYEKGLRWAEPSIPEAANAMRRVFDHRGEARLLSEQARYFSPQQRGRRLLDRQRRIRSGR